MAHFTGVVPLLFNDQVKRIYLFFYLFLVVEDFQ